MDIQDIQDSINRIIPQTGKGDVVASLAETASVSFEMDQLKSVEDNERFAIGLRLFQEGRVGNSYINNPDDLPELLQRARQSAALGEKIDFELPGPVQYPEMEHYFPQVLEYSKEAMLQDLTPLIDRLKQLDPRVQVSLDYSRGQSSQFLCNTQGFQGVIRETHSAFSASVLLVEDSGSLLEIGDSDSSFALDEDREKVLQNIEWRFRHAQKKASLDSGYYPVLFAPEAVSLLLQPITLSASSRTLYKGVSLFQGREGEQVCSPQFSLWDDPCHSAGLASYPFDDEGVLPRTLPLIEGGCFHSYIFDLAYASRLERESTGHGGRSISSLPGPSYTNLIVGPGKADLDGLLHDIDRGILVVDVLGEGMSNTLAGDVSVNIELGYLIEKGKIKGRIKDMMLAGNVFEWLKRIIALENRQHRTGTLHTPHILIDQVSVAG